MLQSVSISVLEVELLMPVRYFIHYPQIIHTAFRAAVYPIAMNPGKGIRSSEEHILRPGRVDFFPDYLYRQG